MKVVVATVTGVAICASDDKKFSHFSSPDRSPNLKTDPRVLLILHATESPDLVGAKAPAVVAPRQWRNIGRRFRVSKPPRPCLAHALSLNPHRI